MKTIQETVFSTKDTDSKTGKISPYMEQFIRKGSGKEFWISKVDEELIDKLHLFNKGLTDMQSYISELEEKVRISEWRQCVECETNSRAENWFGKENRELYKTVVESIAEGLVITDVHDIILYVNSSIRKLTGYTLQELIGKEASSLFLKPKEYLKVEDRLLRRLSGVIESYELQIRRKDGSYFWANINGAPGINENGEIIGTVGVFTDITISKRENELEKLLLAATKSQNSVIITDKFGNVEWVNEGFSILTGYTEEEALSRPVCHFRSCNHEEYYDEYINKVITSKQHLAYEMKNSTKTGEEFWVISTLSPVTDESGDVERVIIIDSNITDRKKMEDELMHAKNVAEQALKKANHIMEDLIKAKLLVEETSRAKEKFLANMSHEIRTPMNGIIGLTNLLLKSEISNEQEEFLNAIKTSGDTLLVVINDILDISKIEAGKMTLDNIPLSVTQLSASIVELVKPVVNEKQIEFHQYVDPNIPEIIGDPARLNQILMNVLGNAVKFTNRGMVNLIVECKKQTNDSALIVFKIIDTGRGIRQENLNDIFLDYSQVNTEVSRKYGGTGLGLAITKKLVELHGGKIQLDSKWKEGTTVTIEITFKLNSGKYITQSNNNNSYEDEGLNILEGFRVLLVEDNPINQMLAKKVLGDWGCIIDTVGNGKRAIQRLRESSGRPYDLIFMDIKMPEMDGYEATRIIRKEFEEPVRSIPVIAQTAHASLWDVDKCFECGMNDFVSKPFQLDELQEKLLKIAKEA